MKMLQLFSVLKPFRVMIAGILIAVFLQTLSDLYIPSLMAEIINEGVLRGDTATILRIGVQMLSVSVLGAIFAVIGSYLSSKTSMHLGSILRNQVFCRVESYSLQEFERFGTPTLITRTTNDITQIQTFSGVLFRIMIGAPLMAIGGVFLASMQDIFLTLVLVLGMLVLAATIGLIASKMVPLFRRVQLKIDKLNLILREKLTGIRVMRAFQTETRELKRFEDANLDLTNHYIRVNQILAYMFPAIMLIMNLTILAVLWFGGIRVSQGLVELGEIIAFIQYATLIMFAMIMFSMMFSMLPRTQAAVARINEVLQTMPEIIDPIEPKEPKETAASGRVEFQNVTFRYPGAEEPALQNISFVANPGEITAIIGSTGAGKSTLVHLIPRLYDVQHGRVLVDGIDVREMTQEVLRRKIGLVPQKSILFSGTISENIRFGSSHTSAQEIEQAAMIAQASEFILEKKEGFSFPLAQGANQLSGGQKQRLSIARALAKNPPIYIFDDSFSALDYKTDANLRRALKEEMKGATVIIVAQRVSTIMNATQILVLEEGRIVNVGTHNQLKQSCRVYREIVMSQLTEEEIH